jgi:uncharacterized membrane protein
MADVSLSVGAIHRIGLALGVLDVVFNTILIALIVNIASGMI